MATDDDDDDDDEDDRDQHLMQEEGGVGPYARHAYAAQTMSSCRIVRKLGFEV
jgi:hypothetical protein